MRLQPGADLEEHTEIAAHITDGVSLPFLSLPATVAYSNTPTV